MVSKSNWKAPQSEKLEDMVDELRRLRWLVSAGYKFEDIE